IGQQETIPKPAREQQSAKSAEAFAIGDANGIGSNSLVLSPIEDGQPEVPVQMGSELLGSRHLVFESTLHQAGSGIGNNANKKDLPSVQIGGKSNDSYNDELWYEKDAIPKAWFENK